MQHLSKRMSASMLVDTQYRQPVLFKPRHPASWVPDERAHTCFKCNATFVSVLCRRHHCRLCGRVFCGDCCYVFAVPALYFDMGNTPVRVCNDCNAHNKECKKIDKLILMMIYLPLSMKEKWALRSVSKDWNLAWTCVSEFRSLQYRLPCQNITRYEKAFLKVHERDLAGHSRWMVAYAYAHDTINMTLPRHTNCRVMMCTRACQHTLDDGNMLELLTHGIKSPHFKIYDKTAWLMYWWIEAGLTAFCLDALAEATLQGKTYAIRNIRQNLPKESLVMYTAIQEFVKTLKHIRDAKTKERMYTHKRNLFDKFRNVPYPWDDKRIVDIITNDVKILPSNSKPAIIPLMLHDGTIEQALYKNEDVRNDRLAMTVAMWIQRLTDPPIHVPMYEVMPTTKNSGIIHLFEGARTLYDIKYNLQMPIVTYIMEKNPTYSAQHIQHILVDSIAASCIFSYILGIGDRHLENILVLRDGQFAQVDMGYILGDDPHGVPCEMRITGDMLMALGNTNSETFLKFKNRCEQCYQDIRKAAPLWYALFKHRGRERAEKWVKERLVPGEWSTSTTQIVDIVHRSSGSGSWMQNVIDVARAARKRIV